MDIDDRATKAIGMSNGDSRERERSEILWGRNGREEREREGGGEHKECESCDVARDIERERERREGTVYI